ncbi:unnamed protein product [Durusdinium trenchii]|uniref:PNPLA domain-containing protein n=3 Tax=Durusdinium trenchii TaxID=1381693 RepID=A0ABP0NRV8_9DINO
MGAGGSHSSTGPTLLASVKAVHDPKDTSWHPPITYALCVAGGGARAFSYSLGVFRALSDLNLLDKIDGIASVSGGTWLSCIYVFAKTFKGSPVSSAQLLGATAPPTRAEELSMSKLQELQPAIASGLAEGDSDKILAELAVQYVGREWEVWPQVMSRWLLRHFDELGSLDRCLAQDEAHVARITARNPSLEPKSFLTPRPDRRQALVMCGAALAPVDRLATKANAVVFQMSADYVGSPFYPKNTQVDYQKAPLCPCDACCYQSCKTMRTVGGGFVESFAFGGTAPTKGSEQKGGTDVAVGAPARPFSLPCAAGISSWGPGGALNESELVADIANIRQLYWPVTSPQLPMPQAAVEYELADGGCVDTSGLLSQLQRKATRLVSIVPSDAPLDAAAVNGPTVTVESFKPDVAGVYDALYVLFGYEKPGTGRLRQNDQVFDRALLLPIVRELKVLVDAGKPAVLKKTLQVLPNDWWGIAGNCEVELIIVVLEVCREFQDLLPADTKQELAKWDGAFPHFPYYKTVLNNLTDLLGLTWPQVNLLAAQAEYSVKTNAALFQELFAA